MKDRGAAGARARELGTVLRARRERLRPEEVGIPAGARRRTRGLRREEVALLASISPTYYTFLEQGRNVRPSRQVLDALAGALRLSEAERRHLHDLAHGEEPGSHAPVESLAPGLGALVDRLDPHPAYVTGRRWDVLAANRSARTLWTDWYARDPGERNLLRWMLTAPAARDLFAEWEKETRAQLARFRAAAARYGGDAIFGELIEQLHAESPEVRDWWPQHEVAPLRSGSKRLRIASLGELELEHVVLQVADDPEQKLVTFRASEADGQRIAALIRATGLVDP